MLRFFFLTEQTKHSFVFRPSAQHKASKPCYSEIMQLNNHISRRAFPSQCRQRLFLGNILLFLCALCGKKICSTTKFAKSQSQTLLRLNQKIAAKLDKKYPAANPFLLQNCCKMKCRKPLLAKRGGVGDF
jgi:hypothetical protein